MHSETNPKFGLGRMNMSKDLIINGIMMLLR